MNIPSAVVRTVRSSAIAWARAVWRAATVGVGLSILVGIAVGVSQAGCRNDAITYAKAIWPEASCTAINTSAGCAENGPDVAVCRVGKLRYKCVASTRYDEPGCTEVHR